VSDITAHMEKREAQAEARKIDVEKTRDAISTALEWFHESHDLSWKDDVVLEAPGLSARERAYARKNLRWDIVDDSKPAISRETAAELLEALKSRCKYHHLPLKNGWAHVIQRSFAPKTARCTLTESERAVIAKAERKGS
jgi:hypothetical protein